MIGEFIRLIKTRTVLFVIFNFPICVLLRLNRIRNKLKTLISMWSLLKKVFYGVWIQIYVWVQTYGKEKMILYYIFTQNKEVNILIINIKGFVIKGFHSTRSKWLLLTVLLFIIPTVVYFIYVYYFISKWIFIVICFKRGSRITCVMLFIYKTWYNKFFVQVLSRVSE